MIKLLPFQEIGRDFLALRSNAILGDDMGLGKTYQALEAIKKARIPSGIIVCPQSIRRSWVKRIREQIPDAFIKEITSPKYIPEVSAFNVVNYDLIWKEPFVTMLKETQWPLLLCDESHYLKNIEAKRTKTLLGRNGIHNRCVRRWLMTGTPILNRPVELYPALRALFPEFLGKYRDFYDYAYHFCSGHQGPFGFDCTGASNLDELSNILRPIMLRRLKSDVQSQLPAVSYEKIYLDSSDKLIKLTELERREFDAKKVIGEISSLRRALGVIKAQATINHLTNILEEKQKIVVFVWHKDVAAMITEAFPGKVVKYTGTESPKEKDAAVESFRNNPAINIFVGQILSAGIGLDGLQYVCDTCVFAEMSYVPGEIRQAVDRLSRMGQTKPVLAQFLIAENSIDERVIDTLTEKAKNINTILGERGTTDFIGTKCKVCGKTTEIASIKRVIQIPVCQECRKNMECLL